MSPIKQRIAIAEYSGYKWQGIREEKDCIGWILYNQYISYIPDYVNNHNAIQEAVNTLGLTLKTAYASNLFDICGSWAATVWATPEQKCKAFLKTIGKWENENE